jgi:hypothetical protein
LRPEEKLLPVAFAKGGIELCSGLILVFDKELIQRRPAYLRWQRFVGVSPGDWRLDDLEDPALVLHEKATGLCGHQTEFPDLLGAGIRLQIAR